MSENPHLTPTEISEYETQLAMETCDKCGKDWVKSPVQMRGLASPTTRHPSLGDDRLKHFCDRVCLMRYLLTPEEMKTLRGDKSK